MWGNQTPTTGNMSNADWSAFLHSHTDWENGATIRGMSYGQQLESLLGVEQNQICALSHEELLEKQTHDHVIDRVKFFVKGGRQPSMREKVYES